MDVGLKITYRYITECETYDKAYDVEYLGKSRFLFIQ